MSQVCVVTDTYAVTIDTLAPNLMICKCDLIYVQITVQTKNLICLQSKQSHSHQIFS